MSSTSSIEWTDATWNPVRGCSIVSKGCTNCYAMKQAHRFSGAGAAYEGLTQLTKGGPVWTGKVRLVHELLDAPLHWRAPRRIFVNSMSDLFHEDVDAEFIGTVLGIASACPQHTFQVLTKRAARMREILASDAFLWAYEGSQDMYTDAAVRWPAPNVWLGVSVEDQAAAASRIPALVQTPAAVRWISAEPLLGPVDLEPYLAEFVPSGIEYGRGHNRTDIGRVARYIDWVVAGGESGPGARPMHPDWVNSIRHDCAEARVPFFFKQWGDWAPASIARRHDSYKVNDTYVKLDGTRHTVGDQTEYDASDVPMVRIGKKAAGRVLDGRTHDDYPALT